jgi:RHS repeat-associated protein
VNPLDQVIAEVRPGGVTAKTTFNAAGYPVDRCFWSSATTEACHEATYAGYVDSPDTASSTVYDARNNRIALITPEAGQTTYDPDHDYAIAANYITVGANIEAQSLYAYDDRHRLTSITQQRCTVSPGTHACSGSVTPLGSDAYEYDDNDNRTRVVESNGATSSDRFYCYDARNQLLSVRSVAGCGSGLLESYSYDEAGNRESKTVSGVTTSYMYDAEGQLASCSPTCGTITYDAAGRTATWNGWYLSYDAESRLLSACKAASCPGTADQITMTYDGEGHRTSLTVKPANQAASTTSFRYQGDAIVEESIAGVVTRRYVIDETGSIVKMVIPAGQANVGTYLVTWNGHGDATALWRVDTGGALTLANSFTYDSWGAPTVATHNLVPDLAFRFLYIGSEDVAWDGALGLVLASMHARHYSPALGRFVQPDPSDVEPNAYAYARNSCISQIDPAGTSSYSKWSRDMCQDGYDDLISLAVRVARRALEQRRGHVDYAAGHDKAYRQLRAALLDKFNKFNNHGCGKYSYRRPLDRIERITTHEAQGPRTQYVQLRPQVDPNIVRVVGWSTATGMLLVYLAARRFGFSMKL